MTERNSYGQILEASSIMGGAAGVTTLLSMVRIKFAAVLIGTGGIGMLASFVAVQGLMSTFWGLGIQSSAVRDIASAVARKDNPAIARQVQALRRICWITGLVGLATAVLLSPVISTLTFGTDDYRLDFSALGVTLLLVNISGGQMALIQGMRRIGDMARIQILGAVGTTFSAIAFYSAWGMRGIVPALVTSAGIQLALSWYYSRKIPLSQVELGWRDTFAEADNMVRLGLVLMWNGLMVSAVSYITIALITTQNDIPAVGLYSAAFAISAASVGFVLTAMGADYYPRLSSVVQNPVAMSQMVNEQAEIGLLMAVPVLLATMALAPWVIHLLYSPAFLGAVELLQWFVLGCLGRVVSWPLSFVMLALGKARWFFFTETTFNLLHIGLIAFGLFCFGIEGVAIAFFVQYLGYIVVVYLVARRLIDFRWSKDFARLSVLSFASLSLTFATARWLPIWAATIVGSFIASFVTAYAVRMLMLRVRQDQYAFKFIEKIPGLKVLRRLLKLHD